MSSSMKGLWIAVFLAVPWLAAPAATEAGQIFFSIQDPAAHWSIPSSRDLVGIYFREDDWHDTCPPELEGFTVDGFQIVIRFMVDRESGCVPEPGTTPYNGTARVGRLPVGDYTVIVEAPDFTTGEIEETRATLEVVEPVQCGLARQPAATVLLPYFEVDLENPDGRTTLFSVGSVRQEPVLAHAVVWTNWGNPALSFDFFVPADGVASFNVRNILLGQLIETAPPSDPPEAQYESCTDPVTLPMVDEQELRALLTGQPHPRDGFCYSSAVEGGELATGYITVDVVRDCSGAELRTPFDPGYFVDLGAGLATNDNALIGDFALVDPSNDFAQGETLVPLIADAERFGWPSFYRADDNRMPLPVALRSRFLNGVIFTGGTDLLVWMESRTQPRECGARNPNQGFLIKAESRAQSGGLPQTLSVDTDQHAFRLTVGGDQLPVEPRFGMIDVGARHWISNPGPPSIRLIQTWMMPIVKADGRFSIGLEGFPVEDFCR